MKKILILGSTGSIGKQTLDIVRENPEKFSVAALTCGIRVSDLEEQIKEFSPEAVCVGDEEAAPRIKEAFPKVKVYTGAGGLKEIAKIDCDIVVNALMGISGLAPTYEAIAKGRRIALANKETLVSGGRLITEAAKENGAEIIPVDSEHSAIFQCLHSRMGSPIERIILTASGGPFRGCEIKDLENVTVKEALNHPKWKMGSKITIDSATMMNKGLEMIEAKWLFGVEPEKIDIHVHPESIIHSMVEFSDTSVIAQLGLPDMRIPIGLALNYPERLPYSGEKPDFFKVASELHFEKPRRDVFRCIDIAYEAIREGGSFPAAINGANEKLVSLFLEGRIKFLDIQRTLEKVAERHIKSEIDSVDEILDVDAEARREAERLIGSQRI